MPRPKNAEPRVRKQRSAEKVTPSSRRLSEPTPSETARPPAAGVELESGASSSSTKTPDRISEQPHQNIVPIGDSAGGAGEPPNGQTPKMTQPKSVVPKKKIECVYVYTDEDGKPLYESVRFKPKSFAYRHHDEAGKLAWNLDGVRKVLYRLSDFAHADGLTVFVVEGEKDVETARKLGLIATCSISGAQGWKPQFAEYLHKHRVVIIPDNDEPGEVYAEVVAGSVDGIALDWRIVRLPGLQPKGDLTDFVEAGGTKESIDNLVADAFSRPREEMIPLPINGTASKAATAAHPQQPADPEWSIHSKCFADIVPEHIDWFWKGLWVNKTLNLLTGPPGVGKTFVACHLAAAVSKGMEFPDGGGSAPLGDAVYCCTEDSLPAVIRPRLDAAGADVRKVHTWLLKTTKDRDGKPVEKELSIEDVELIEKKIDAMPSLRLLIFDPVTAYVGGKNTNDNGEMRPLLEKLRNVAESRGICILLITHQKKGQAQAINATMGAQAFTAVPRSVYMLRKDPHDKEKRLRCLSPVKNNNGPDQMGKQFHLESTPDESSHCHIVWRAEPDRRTADEIMTAEMEMNCAAGRESNEEKLESKSEGKFFEVLDAESQPDGTWVAVKRIRDILNWNGSRMTQMIWKLVRSSRIERREAPKNMPNEGIQHGGREEVRRLVAEVPWSPG